MGDARIIVVLLYVALAAIAYALALALNALFGITDYLADFRRWLMSGVRD